MDDPMTKRPKSESEKRYDSCTAPTYFSTVSKSGHGIPAGAAHQRTRGRELERLYLPNESIPVLALLETSLVSAHCNSQGLRAAYH